MAVAAGSWQADVQKDAYEDAEILLEAKGVPDFIAEDMISSFAAKARPKEPKPQRKHHYTFDVDDNGLDINGFILHTDKHKGKRHKFRVYLDSNENGRFDKKDELIGRSGLKQKHAAKGVGDLLDEGEIGQLEVKFKKLESNASMRVDEVNYPTIRDTPLYQPLVEGDLSFINIKSMSFSDSDGSELIGGMNGYI